jgi:hypothetical protein
VRPRWPTRLRARAWATRAVVAHDSQDEDTDGEGGTDGDADPDGEGEGDDEGAGVDGSGLGSHGGLEPLETGAQLTWTLCSDEDEEEDGPRKTTALPPPPLARRTVTISVMLCPAWSVP